MTSKKNAEKEYLDALQRLLDKKSTVSLNAVAIEAGKKPGSLRAARLPNLVAEIQRVIEIQSKQLITHKEPRFEEKIRTKDKELESLKRDYTTALQRVVSLERQVFELQAELRKYKPNSGTLHELPTLVKREI